MKSVYAYIRVSTVKQGEHGSSLTEQRLAIEEYARRHDLTIVQLFEEKETAAKRGRTQFNQMLSLLIKGKAGGVVIHKIDRGARNLKDWADLGGLIDKGIEVHFAHESLDMQSRGGRLAADIQAVVAADFIRNLRDEVKKGFLGRLRQGLYPLRAPIGYKDQGRGLPKIPDPIMAPLVQQAFQLYATGQSNLYMLGREMYKVGLRNRAGSRVSRNGLSTMLNNEFYIGVMHITSMGERFPGIHEPIIKKSTFDQVQNVLHGRTKNAGLKHSFCYRKIMQCAQCKYNLIAERQKGIVYYRCHTQGCSRTCVREDAIDAQLKEAVSTIWMPQEEIQELEEEFSHIENDRSQHLENLIAAKELMIAHLDAKIMRLTDAYIDRLIEKGTFDERNRTLLHERAQARESLQEMRNGINASSDRTKAFLELIKKISETKKKGNEYEHRDLLKSVTSNFQMDGKRFVVAWKSPFDELVLRSKLDYCEQHRDTYRTFDAKDRKKKQPSRFSKKLFDLIQADPPNTVPSYRRKKRNKG